ncbi:hypothetical protein [Thermofilum pendens]|nr:hypothetical protein [Thermofilum pendens]
MKRTTMGSGLPRAVTALTLVMLLAFTSMATGEATVALATASVSGRVEYGYALVFVNLDLKQPVNSLRFNLSKYKDYLVLAVARAGNAVVKANVDGDFAVFVFPAPYSKVNVTFVFDSLSVEDGTVKVLFPVPLSPAGFICNVTGRIFLPQVTGIKTSYGNVAGTGVSYNRTVLPATLDLVAGNASSTSLQLYKVTYLQRQILIEDGKAVFNDTITVRSLSDAWVEALGFNLPKNAALEGVYWGFGKVPSRYISTYSGNASTLVMYSLLSSLQSRGQETTFSVVYSMKFNNSVPAFMGLGFLVKNYSVSICLRGLARIDGNVLAESVEGDVHCYFLKPVGPLFLSDTYQPVQVSATFASKSAGVPLGVYLLAVLVLLLVMGAVYYSSRRRISEAKAEALEKSLSQRRGLEELERILVSRERALEELVEQLRDLRGRKAGITKVTSVLRLMEQRNREYDKLLRDALKGLEGDWSKIFSELDEFARMVEEKIRELEKIERAYRSGRLAKKEYVESAEKIEEEILSLAREFTRRVTRLLSA